jgi:putative ABC transport system substrate-binding protein
MRRRNFITLLGGAAAAWPLGARAQRGERVRHIGVLMNLASDDPEAQERLAAFAQGLEGPGWTIGRNVRIDIRWGAGDDDLMRKYAVELVALTPDAILANGSAVFPLLQATRVVPIVFAQVPDPVGSGIAASLARPGGNVTGFSQFEFSMSGKWLELLMQIAPNLAQVGVLRDTVTAAGVAQFAAIQAVARSSVEVTALGVRDAEETERILTAFASRPNGGLIVTASGLTALHRSLIIGIASRYRLPAVYPFRYFVAAGGLISYGPDPIDQYRRAAGYVDRVLKGEKASDLPIQQPTKFELVVNLKTARTLGLDVPPTLLAIADEVIE